MVVGLDELRELRSSAKRLEARVSARDSEQFAITTAEVSAAADRAAELSAGFAREIVRRRKADLGVASVAWLHRTITDEPNKPYGLWWVAEARILERQGIDESELVRMSRLAARRRWLVDPALKTDIASDESLVRECVERAIALVERALRTRNNRKRRRLVMRFDAYLRALVALGANTEQAEKTIYPLSFATAVIHLSHRRRP